MAPGGKRRRRTPAYSGSASPTIPQESCPAAKPKDLSLCCFLPVDIFHLARDLSPRDRAVLESLSMEEDIEEETPLLLDPADDLGAMPSDILHLIHSAWNSSRVRDERDYLEKALQEISNNPLLVTALQGTIKRLMAALAEVSATVQADYPGSLQLQPSHTAVLQGSYQAKPLSAEIDSAPVDLLNKRRSSGSPLGDPIFDPTDELEWVPQNTPSYVNSARASFKVQCFSEEKLYLELALREITSRPHLEYFLPGTLKRLSVAISQASSRQYSHHTGPSSPEPLRTLNYPEPQTSRQSQLDCLAFRTASLLSSDLPLPQCVPDWSSDCDQEDSLEVGPPPDLLDFLFPGNKAFVDSLFPESDCSGDEDFQSDNVSQGWRSKSPCSLTKSQRRRQRRRSHQNSSPISGVQPLGRRPESPQPHGRRPESPQPHGRRPESPQLSSAQVLCPPVPAPRKARLGFAPVSERPDTCLASKPRSFLPEPAPRSSLLEPALRSSLPDAAPRSSLPEPAPSSSLPDPAPSPSLPDPPPSSALWNPADTEPAAQPAPPDPTSWSMLPSCRYSLPPIRRDPPQSCRRGLPLASRRDPLSVRPDSVLPSCCDPMPPSCRDPTPLGRRGPQPPGCRGLPLSAASSTAPPAVSTSSTAPPAVSTSSTAPPAPLGMAAARCLLTTPVNSAPVLQSVMPTPAPLPPPVLASRSSVPVPTSGPQAILGFALCPAWGSQSTLYAPSDLLAMLVLVGLVIVWSPRRPPEAPDDFVPMDPASRDLWVVLGQFPSRPPEVSECVPSLPNPGLCASPVDEEVSPQRSGTRIPPSSGDPLDPSETARFPMVAPAPDPGLASAPGLCRASTPDPSPAGPLFGGFCRRGPRAVGRSPGVLPSEGGPVGDPCGPDRDAVGGSPGVLPSEGGPVGDPCEPDRDSVKWSPGVLPLGGDPVVDSCEPDCCAISSYCCAIPCTGQVQSVIIKMIELSFALLGDYKRPTLTKFQCSIVDDLPGIVPVESLVS